MPSGVVPSLGTRVVSVVKTNWAHSSANAVISILACASQYVQSVELGLYSIMNPSSEGNALRNILLKILYQMDRVFLTFSWFQCANS